jgi:hypothetical protein
MAVVFIVVVIIIIIIIIIIVIQLQVQPARVYFETSPLPGLLMLIELFQSLHRDC